MKKITRIVAAVNCSFAITVSAFEMVRDGQPTAEIVVDVKACPSTQTAALELQKYLERMSGAKLPIVNTPTGKPPVYVGKSEYTDNLGITMVDIKYDGFKIIVNNKYAVIAGIDDNRLPIPRGFTDISKARQVQEEWEKATGTKTVARFYRDPRRVVGAPGRMFHYRDATGTLYGVYDLLERLGVRFFMPVEGIGQVVPKMKDVILPDLNVKDEPDFAARCLTLTSQGDGLDQYWYKQLRQGGIYDQWPAHTSMNVVDTNRSELLVYRNGVAVSDRLPRLASAELRLELVNYLVNMKKFYPEIDNLAIGQPDGWTVLDDRDVKAGWDKRDEGDWGRFSDYTWDFILDVVRQVREKLPDAKFNTMCYGYAKKPPKILDKIPGDISIYFTQASMGWHESPDELALRRDWEKKAPNSDFYVYDYYLSHNPNRDAPALPHIFLENIDKNFKNMGSQYKGLFFEVSNGGPNFLKSKYRSLIKYPVLNALTYYVHGKLSWHKNADVKAILTDFYDKFFGPAKNEMKEFYEYAEKMWMAPPASNSDKRAMVQKYFEILDCARAKAGKDTDYGKRIALIAEEMAPAKDAFKDSRNGPVVKAWQVKTELHQINGDLEKDFWSKNFSNAFLIAKDNFTAVYPQVNQTYVRLRWVNDLLLVGITCMDRHMNSLRAAVPQGQSNTQEIYLDDNVEIYLETTSGYRVKLVVNPNGATLTHLFSSPDVTEVTWLPEAVGVKKHDDRWTVEVNLGKFSGEQPLPSTPWGINVCRQRLANGDKEYYSISPTGGRFDNFARHANLSLR